MGLFDQINKSESTEQALKEKHLPKITIENIGSDKHKVKVDVGEGKHPNDMDHWIQWVELRMNDLFIGRAEFSASVLEPVAEFVVNCKGNCKINALARCNKHGLWESSVQCQ